MSITIRATCGDCGDVSLKDSEVTLRLCVDDKQGSYRFRCPECGRVVLKSADSTTFQLLSTTEARFESWTLPLELSEPRPGGDPITCNDVIDFYDLMEGRSRPDCAP